MRLALTRGPNHEAAPARAQGLPGQSALAHAPEGEGPAPPDGPVAAAGGPPGLLRPTGPPRLLNGYAFGARCRVLGKAGIIMPQVGQGPGPWPTGPFGYGARSQILRPPTGGLRMIGGRLVTVSPSFCVILSPSPVILSEAKNLPWLRVNSAKSLPETGTSEDRKTLPSPVILDP